MKEFWNERFSEPGYAYGEEPNEYLRQKLAKYKPGTILFPAEGEGRNAVYAAAAGWEVFAFDFSLAGRKKALELAGRKGVRINYLVKDVESVRFTEGHFDALGFFYAHFAGSNKMDYYRKCCSFLKVGGLVLMEAFSKKHLEYNSINPKVGGPQSAEVLFSTQELTQVFFDFEVFEMTEREVELNEGKYHIGVGSVVRFCGRKIN